MNKYTITGILIAGAVLVSCSRGPNGGAGSYDGLWTADISNHGFTLNTAVAISASAFSISGLASPPPGGCGADISLTGSINSSGVLSGSWTSTICDGTSGTFPGNCPNTNSCSATGSLFQLTLTRQGTADLSTGGPGAIMIPKSAVYSGPRFDPMLGDVSLCPDKAREPNDGPDPD